MGGVVEKTNNDIIYGLMKSSEVLKRSKVKPAGFRSAMQETGIGWGDVPEKEHDLAVEWWERLNSVTDKTCHEALALKTEVLNGRPRWTIDQASARLGISRRTFNRRVNDACDEIRAQWNWRKFLKKAA